MEQERKAVMEGEAWLAVALLWVRGTLTRGLWFLFQAPGAR